MDRMAVDCFTRTISNKDKTDMSQKVRVCFYARVSTQHEAQMNALDNQLQWYDDILERHPNWEKVKVYADRGITGTQAKKRPEFMKMINDAYEGKIDLICTREVSRFARNTVDSLAYTRQLRSIGVEVYFVNDNIWSCEGDGEFRLTIMSAMSQDESRHISERTSAGQAISRKKGVLYGNGNILGYTLKQGSKSVDNTYVIDEEQAETVKLIYDLYLEGYGTKDISSKLIAMGRPTAMGGNKWSASKVLRVLNNKTYAGYIGYNKSYKVNFLDDARVNINDMSQHIYIKGNFPAIIPEDKWNRVQALKAKKVSYVNNAPIGKKLSKDKWKRVLKCECGSSYKKFKWRVNKSGEVCYGYQCCHQVNYRKKGFREANGLDGTDYCNIPSICDWKLEFMLKSVLKRLWKNPMNTATILVKDIADNYVKSADVVVDIETERLKREHKRLIGRLENLMDMLLDDMIDKVSYETKKQQLDIRIQQIEQQLDDKLTVEKAVEVQEDVSLELDRIKEFLNTVCDLEHKQVSDELVDGIVSRVIPTEAGVFKWYLKGENSDQEVLFDESTYALYDKFTLDFEQAKAYRKKFGNYIRQSQWNDLKVEVYVKI